MEMKMGKLIWNGDEGEVKLSKEFFESYAILQLDALSDWIHILEEKYDEILEEGYISDLKARKEKSEKNEPVSEFVYLKLVTKNSEVKEDGNEQS
jgi:hypothetical protein